jgi:hypothetical protein
MEFKIPRLNNLPKNLTLLDIPDLSQITHISLLHDSNTVPGALHHVVDGMSDRTPKPFTFHVLLS